MLRPSSPPERGFTLVELMLAMAFIGVLLVAVATTTQHMMRLYNKGSTLREINTVARTVVRDLQQSVGSASPFAVGYYAPGAAQTPRVAVGLAQASQYNQHLPTQVIYSQLQIMQHLGRVFSIFVCGATVCSQYGLCVWRIAITAFVSIVNPTITALRYQCCMVKNTSTFLVKGRPI